GAVIRTGWLPGVMPAENSVMTPSGVMRPIRLVTPSVNQRLPSGPAVISSGSLAGERPWVNPVTWPSGVIRPMACISANQRLPSGPAVIPKGSPLGSGIGNSVVDTDNRQRSSNDSTDTRHRAGRGREFGTSRGSRRLPPRSQVGTERKLNIRILLIEEEPRDPVPRKRGRRRLRPPPRVETNRRGVE